jgi:hypothetical protein
LLPDQPGPHSNLMVAAGEEGIVWLVASSGIDRRGAETDAILHAYDAADVSRELYSAVLGSSVRFAMPAIAGGRVYIGARRAVYVYGLRVQRPPD